MHDAWQHAEVNLFLWIKPTQRILQIKICVIHTVRHIMLSELKFAGSLSHLHLVSWWLLFNVYACIWRCQFQLWGLLSKHDGSCQECTSCEHWVLRATMQWSLITRVYNCIGDSQEHVMLSRCLACRYQGNSSVHKIESSWSESAWRSYRQYCCAPDNNIGSSLGWVFKKSTDFGENDISHWHHYFFKSNSVSDQYTSTIREITHDCSICM